MGYINQPFDMHTFAQDIERRLRKLETATRFTAPDVAAVPTYPRTGDIVYNNTENYMEYWDGTTWHIFADTGTASPVIPFTSTWTGTGLTYTGTPALGRYQKIGKQIHVHIRVDCTTVTNFGTGTYSLTLPTGLAAGYDYVLQGGLHSGANHYAIIGDLEIAQTTFSLWYPTANGAIDAMKGSKPKNLTTSDYFYVHGNYLIA